MKLSFCLITLNEESNLARALASCAPVADEIVVLDSGSSDGTRAVAQSFGARWHEAAWPGYVEQKNRVLALATHDWAFSLDADESLSGAVRRASRARACTNAWSWTARCGD